jgi:hypothetical protein
LEVFELFQEKYVNMLDICGAIIYNNAHKAGIANKYARRAVQLRKTIKKRGNKHEEIKMVVDASRSFARAVPDSVR